MRLPLFLAAFACLFTLPCFADARGSDPQVLAESSALWVNETRVLTLHTSLAGQSSEHRAEALANRVRGLNNETHVWVKTPTLKRVIRGHGRRHRRRVVIEELPSRLLMGDDRVLLEISPNEAKSQASSPGGLAIQWASALHTALILPPLKLEAKTVKVPVGGQSSIGLIGSEAGKATISSSDPAILTVGHRQGTMVLKGGSKGTVTITIQGEEATETMSVKVEPYAARFPQNLTVNVVGAPASTDTVSSSVEGIVKTTLRTEPGRELKMTIPKDVRVPAGESRTIPVKVQVTAPDAFPAEGVAIVRIVNSGITNREESELWYCNEPESLKGPSLLFRGELRPDRPVRMLYHHINDSSQTLYLDVEIHNPSDVPARLVVMPGDSRPDTNAVRAGIQAAEPFFQAYLTGSGEVVTLPPHTRIPLSFRRLGKTECGSGLAYLRLLPGGPDTLVVHADARPAAPVSEPWTSAAASPTPWRETGALAETPNFTTGELSDLVFPNPFSEDSIEYQVGGKFAFARIGQTPIPRKTKGDPLQGNFGVVCKINAMAVNPTDRPVDVEVIFDASAGYSGALFVIDGVLRRLPLMQPKAEFQLARFRLAPGAKKVLRLVTIPLSGSSYPATVAVRPVDGIATVGKR